MSTFVLAIVSFQTYISSCFILVAAAYAEAKENTTASMNLPRSYSMAIRNRKFEVSDLYRRFLPPYEALGFTLTTMGDLYGLSWALAAIFASTLGERVPLLRTGTGSDEEVSWSFGSYELYLIIFAIVVLPLSIATVADQLWVQLVFLGCRMLMVTLMLLTLLLAWWGNQRENSFSDYNPTAHHTNVPAYNFSRIILIAMTSVFATAYQFSVPGMAAASYDKKAVRPLLGRATTFVVVSNCIVALVVSLYFGADATDPSSNLHWVYYLGDSSSVDDGGEQSRPVWATCISYYVSLFAAVDGLAVYPLLVISLGDIMMAVVYRDAVHKAERNWRLRCLFRLASGVPQAVGALFVRDLDVIAVYAGICTLLSYTIAPALLFLRSRRQTVDLGLPEKTFYSMRFLTTPLMAYFWIVMASLLIAGIVVDALL